MDMPLNLRASKKVKKFNLPLSYRIYERGMKLIEARNVISTQDRLDTRFGTSRFNAVALDGPILSLSSFVKTDGTVYQIAKVGTALYSVSTTGAHTSIKTGLTSTTKHRGITENDRHIIAIENDGLFSWDGTTFSQLGQAAPATLTATIAAGGALTDTDQYQAAVTYYASDIGFESNAQTSGIVTASGSDLRVVLTNIPATAANAFVDKIRIYLKNVTNDGEFLFISEENLGTTSYNIDNESTSAQTPPEDNGTPLAGGGKFLGFFNSKLVYAGNNSFKNDVFFSEEDLPDAFNGSDTQTVLVAPGQGDITGLGVGLFSDSHLDPFLCVFKRKSTHIYSELGGSPRFVTISNDVGCVSHDTIQVKNGAVYFLSEDGWRAIFNGRLIQDEQGDPITLGQGDIDDIFNNPGFVYEINRSTITNAFSVYYPTLDQYMTWVGEGSNTAFSKCYAYEFQNRGFKPHEFPVIATCACATEDSTRRPIVIFGSSNGYIIKHSINEARSDVTPEGETAPIDAYAVMPWGDDSEDFDATYNYRELILRAIVNSGTITVKTFLNFNFANLSDLDFTFPDPNSGFILDISQLDIGVFGDERAIVTSRADINRVGESLAIGFYQNELNTNLGLVSLQLDLSKNGNRAM
jgi:hypothetical protein